jgi:Cro/C1-type HTH DNA-binding domain
VKIRGVQINNRRRAFEIRASSRRLVLPFAKVDPRPTAADPVVRAFIDKEIGSEGFGYVLRSGREGTAHIEQVLEYNKDPGHLRDQLLYRLTLEAQKRVAASRLSRRELIRRLGTSATQFYRLLDQTNYRKSVDQLVSLLQILDCDVKLVVRPKTA